MKIIAIPMFILFSTHLFSQEKIEWAKDYELELSDFGSPSTEINQDVNSMAYYSGANIDFFFQMSNIEFMLTKNFNEKVTTYFNRNAASIVAPDSVMARQLLEVGRYDFDLTELHSRKFRKKLYEQKGTFASVSFFKPIFEEIQNEMTQRSSDVMKRTNLGKNSELLQQEHDKVLAELERLANFCKTCKPPKRKKRKK